MSTNPFLQARAAKRKATYGKSSKSSSSSAKYARRAAPKYSMNRMVPSWPRAFGDQPHRKYAKLKYSCTATSAGIGVGSLSAFEYRAEGMYDPEVAVGGHQPYGFDQLMTQYFHYTVLRSTCTAEIESTSVNSNQVWMLALYNASATLGAAYAAGGTNALHELPIISQTLMLTGGEYGGRARSMRLSFDAARTFGKPYSNLIGDSRFQGDEAHNPTEDAFFGLVGYDPSGAANNDTVRFKVNIVYYAVFSEPRWFTTS